MTAPWDMMPRACEAPETFGSPPGATSITDSRGRVSTPADVRRRWWAKRGTPAEQMDVTPQEERHLWQATRGFGGLPALIHLSLQRRYGWNMLASMVRRTSHSPVFVHCHECRWPVNPLRTRMQIGMGGTYIGDAYALPASEAQMTAFCQGLRRMDNA